MPRELAPTEVRTGKVRFSYAHVFEPKTPPGSTKPKYSVAILVKKTDAATLELIKKAMTAAINDGIEKKWKGKKPANLKSPMHDGDKERGDDATYAGCYYFNANSDRQPGIVDSSTPPIKITDPEEFYSGCYGRAFVNFYAFDTNGNKGIAVGLQHLQKMEDGDRLSGRVGVDDAFDDWGGVSEDPIF